MASTNGGRGIQSAKNRFLSEAPSLPEISSSAKALIVWTHASVTVALSGALANSPMYRDGRDVARPIWLLGIFAYSPAGAASARAASKAVRLTSPPPNGRRRPAGET